MKRIGKPRGVSQRIAAMVPAATVDELEERIADLEYQLEQAKGAAKAWKTLARDLRDRSRLAHLMVERLRGSRRPS